MSEKESKDKSDGWLGAGPFEIKQVPLFVLSLPYELGEKLIKDLTFRKTEPPSGRRIYMTHTANHVKHKAILCPLCGKGRIIDAAAHIGTDRLLLYGPESEDGAELFIKCPKCGRQVGIAIKKD